MEDRSIILCSSTHFMLMFLHFFRFLSEAKTLTLKAVPGCGYDPFLASHAKLNVFFTLSVDLVRHDAT